MKQIKFIKQFKRRFFPFSLAPLNQCVTTSTCKSSGHSAKAPRSLWSSYTYLQWKDQEAGGAAGTAHLVPLPALSRPPVLISHFAGPHPAGWIKDRIANRNCVCFCLVKPKVLTLFYELDVNDN